MKKIINGKDDMLYLNDIIEFDTENIDGKKYHVRLTGAELLKDWWNECNTVPGNDTDITNVKVNGQPMTKYSGIEFLSFMQELGYDVILTTQKE